MGRVTAAVPELQQEGLERSDLFRSMPIEAGNANLGTGKA